MTSDEKLLGQILVEEGRISPQELERALAHQARHAEMSQSKLVLHDRQQRRRHLLKILLVLAAYVAVTALVVQRYAGVPEERPSRAVIRGDAFYRDGDKFLVKGVGWDPARPGELPWKRSVSVKLVDDDFRAVGVQAAGHGHVVVVEALLPQPGVLLDRPVVADPSESGHHAGIIFRQSGIDEALGTGIGDAAV